MASSLPPEMDRRTFVKGSMFAGLAALAAVPGQAADSAPAAPAAPTASAQGKALVIPPAPIATLPKGKIAGLEISRMLLGGNLLTHYCHSRDLKYVYDLTAHYNTDEKIMETLALAEAHGIDTLSVHTVPRVLELLKRYRKLGGKMKWIICSTAPINAGMSEYTEAVRQLVDDGTEALYVWGVHCDALLAQGKADLIAKAVETIKLSGVPAGVGCHDLRVVEECERRAVPNDFYIKTFHHHKYPSAPRPDEIKGPYNENPGYWCMDLQRTIEVMKTVKKPWIAFKVMAAGAIPPKNAFQYVFQNGADFTLAGMFDYEIATDTQILRELLAGEMKRERPWMA